MNQQAEKFMLSPVVRNAPVRREVTLCPDGKVAIKTTCTKCGKAFTIKMDKEHFLICLTADHSASYACAFRSSLMRKWQKIGVYMSERRYCVLDEKDATVVCDDLTFLPMQCGGCGYKNRGWRIEECRWSVSRDMGEGFRQIESCFARNLRNLPEAQQVMEDADLPLVMTMINGYYGTRKIEIALKSGNHVELSTKCYRCSKIVTSILDSHEFIAILSNEIGVADAMRLWDMIKRSPIKGDFYCLSRYVEEICSVCRQVRDKEAKDYEDYLERLWSNMYLIKEKMHKNADGTFDFERKCSRCGQSHKLHLPMSRLLELESWLEQFTFEWNWLRAYEYDDFRDQYIREFWPELSEREVKYFFEGSECRKCCEELYDMPDLLDVEEDVDDEDDVPLLPSD